MSNLETKLFDLMESWNQLAKDVAASGDADWEQLAQATARLQCQRELLLTLQETRLAEGLDLIL